MVSVTFCNAQDETGVYKNLLQEVSQRVGASLPTYKTSRSGLGHLPIFTCTVELAGVTFTGEPAKNKKQAEKNAAMAAWSALKLCKSSEYVNFLHLLESFLFFNQKSMLKSGLPRWKPCNSADKVR